MNIYIFIALSIIPQLLVFLCLWVNSLLFSLTWYRGLPMWPARRVRVEDDRPWLRRVHRQAAAVCRVLAVPSSLPRRDVLARVEATGRLTAAADMSRSAAAGLCLAPCAPVLVYDGIWITEILFGRPASAATLIVCLSAPPLLFVSVWLQTKWFGRRVDRQEARNVSHTAFLTCATVLRSCWELFCAQRRPAQPDRLVLLPPVAQLEVNLSVLIADLGDWATIGWHSLNPARLREVRQHIAGVQSALHGAGGAVLRGEPEALKRLVTILETLRSRLYQGTWLRLLDDDLIPEGEFELIKRNREASRRDAWVVLVSGTAVTGLSLAAAALGGGAAAGIAATTLVGTVPLLFTRRHLGQEARTALSSVASRPQSP
jgi:hypothetical protein